MILTVEQAEKSWCPMIRRLYILEKEYIMNCHPNDESEIGATCKANKCMMWRWKTQEIDGEEKGCCGLAGISIG